MKLSATIGRLGAAVRSRMGAGRYRHVGFFEHVIGTSLEIQVVIGRPRQGARVERAVLDEISRLEAIFSIYSPDSEFSRWCSSAEEEIPISPELAHVLERAAHWRRVTAGAFDPVAESSSRVWQARAEAAGSIGEATPAGRFAEPPASSPLWKLRPCDGGKGALATRLTAHPLSLNAIAKGFIIDRACAVAAECAGVAEAMINIGGDIRHIGSTSVAVAIADARSDADNCPPIATVEIRNQGIATSGGGRRGWVLEGRHISHLMDPRSGVPAEHVLGATAVAPTATDADALATAFCVMEPERSLALVDRLTGIECLVLPAGSAPLTSRGWPARE